MIFYGKDALKLIKSDRKYIYKLQKTIIINSQRILKKQTLFKICKKV